jgi:oligoendopeptidase F
MKQREKQGFGIFIILSAALCLMVSSLAFAQDAPQRSDIDDAYKWKVEDIYANIDVWEADYKTVEEAIPSLEAYQGRLGESAEVLAEFLKLYEDVNRKLEDLYVFAFLKQDEDTRVSEFQELGGRIAGLNSKLSAALSFMEPELLSYDSEKINGFMDQNETVAVYRQWYDNLLRQQEHVLSPEQEKLISMAGPVTRAPSDIFRMLNNADLHLGKMKDEEGNEVELTRQRYAKFLESADRRVRRDANRVYNEHFESKINSLAATLGASVQKDWFLAQARGYESCVDMALDNSNIPRSVFDNLIDAVDANLAPLHKWTSIRKRILGVDTLYTYDMYAPLMEDQNKEYSYLEATQIVADGLKPMGDAYLDQLKTGLSSGWIDVYETQGKRSGAYNWGTYDSHPFVLLNFNGTLDNVFTLAHEMGHAMHSYYTNSNEPYVYGGHPIFTAEVASTCNEAVLMKYLLENTKDKKEKMILLNHYIEQIIGTFYTQVFFSEFERAIHKHVEEGGAFSADYFRKTYREIYQKYWGPELVIDENNDMGGMRISHFYRQFYVYQYATCYAAAQMISQKILEGDPGSLDNYMEFLKTGYSKYPVQILKDAGVDMTSPEPINRTIKLFSDLVDQMEQLLNEG